ncbi:hypothetical protein FRC11_010290, partial [Ceratobasidium sp. 423]
MPPPIRNLNPPAPKCVFPVSGTGPGVTLDELHAMSDLACAETHWDLQAPIQSMTGSAANKLGRYHLSTTRWTWLDGLQKTLPLFKDPTDFFSQKEVPLVHEVLPSLLTLRLRLEFLRDDVHAGIPSIIRLAAYSALDVLNKYMSLLEESDVYWMAV